MNTRIISITSFLPTRNKFFRPKENRSDLEQVHIYTDITCALLLPLHKISLLQSNIGEIEAKSPKHVICIGHVNSQLKYLNLETSPHCIKNALVYQLDYFRL